MNLPTQNEPRFDWFAADLWQRADIQLAVQTGTEAAQRQRLPEFLLAIDTRGQVFPRIGEVYGGERKIAAVKLFGKAWVVVPTVPLSATPPPESTAIKLTRRQRETLLLLGRGLSRKEMADALVVSISTLDFHVRHIYQALGSSNHANCIVKAREIGLLE